MGVGGGWTRVNLSARSTAGRVGFGLSSHRTSTITLYHARGVIPGPDTVPACGGGATTAAAAVAQSPASPLPSMPLLSMVATWALPPPPPPPPPTPVPVRRVYRRDVQLTVTPCTTPRRPARDDPRRSTTCPTGTARTAQCCKSLKCSGVSGARAAPTCVCVVDAVDAAAGCGGDPDPGGVPRARACGDGGATPHVTTAAPIAARSWCRALAATTSCKKAAVPPLPAAVPSTSPPPSGRVSSLLWLPTRCPFMVTAKWGLPHATMCSMNCVGSHHHSCWTAASSSAGRAWLYGAAHPQQQHRNNQTKQNKTKNKECRAKRNLMSHRKPTTTPSCKNHNTTTPSHHPHTHNAHLMRHNTQRCLHQGRQRRHGT